MLTVDRKLSDVPAIPSHYHPSTKGSGQGPACCQAPPIPNSKASWERWGLWDSSLGPLLFSFQASSITWYQFTHGQALGEGIGSKEWGQTLSSLLIVMGLGPDSLRVINKNPGKRQLSCLTRR